MSFFNNLWNTNNELKSFWLKLKTENDLQQLYDDSFSTKIAIFKHSTRCIISKSMLSSFENEVENAGLDYKFYYLEVLKHRNLSNSIAEKFSVNHQSPQLLLIEKGKCTAHASHEQISITLL